jgi:hypothetical protein
MASKEKRRQYLNPSKNVYMKTLLLKMVLQVHHPKPEGCR